MNKFITEAFRENSSLYVKYAFNHYLQFTGRLEDYRDLVPVKSKPRKKHGVYLKKEQLLEIIENISDERYRTVALIQFLTGARAHDVFSFDKNNMWLQDDGSLKLILGIKGGREHTVFIMSKFVPRVTQFIEKVNKKNPFLRGQSSSFTNLVNNNYRYYFTILKNAAKKCGHDAFATHDFRRNLSDDIYSITKDVGQVSKAIGVTPNTAMKYINTKVKEGDTKKLIQKVRS